MLLDPVHKIVRQVDAFRVSAHEVLSRHEVASESRVISLESTRRQLQGLTLNQSDLLREALDCIELGKFRAAHVAAWQALIDLLTEKIASDGFVALGGVRTRWPAFATVEELREFTNEHELVNVAKDLGLIAKSEVRILHGMLSERNECGHPSSYHPGLNESLGYVAKIMNRMEKMLTKTL